jgi:hypothetical protein
MTFDFVLCTYMHVCVRVCRHECVYVHMRAYSAGIQSQSFLHDKLGSLISVIIISPVNLSVEVLTDMEVSLWLVEIEAVFVKAP